MPLPKQTFSDIDQLLGYTNTKIVPNGGSEVDATEMNNVLNGAITFIPKYTVNSGNGGVIWDSGGNYSLTSPLTVFTDVLPTQVTWPTNVQNEYYIVNTLDSQIPLTGAANSSFIDQFGVVYDYIPPNTSIHIGKLVNGRWVLLNNLGGITPPPPSTGVYSSTYSSTY